MKKLLSLKYSGEASDLEKLAHKMWTLFMVSNAKSKKILVVLFGRVNKSDEKDLDLFSSCGFGEIWTESQHLIRRAQ